MRVTTAFKRLLRLEGVNVTDVAFGSALIVVTVVLRRRRPVCGHCSFTTRYRYDTRPVESAWRHLDLGCYCGTSSEPREVLTTTGKPTTE